MTAKTKTANQSALTAASAAIASLLPDNNTREITPQDMRDCFVEVGGVLTDVIDSYGDRGSQRLGALRGGASGITPYYTVALSPMGINLTPSLLTIPVVSSPSVQADPGAITFLKAGWAQAHMLVSASYSSNSQAQLEIYVAGTSRARSNIISGNGATEFKAIVSTGVFPVVVNDVLSVRGFHLAGPGSTFSATSASLWVKYED
jgi:hypothetical protein